MQRVALVTGGARGIGAAIVRELAKDGYDVVINYLTSFDAAEKLKSEVIDTYGVRCLSIKCDVANESEVDQMISEIERELGGVDILINNAAIDLSNLFHLKDAKDFRRTFDVNVVGAFNCANSLCPVSIYSSHDSLYCREPVSCILSPSGP